MHAWLVKKLDGFIKAVFKLDNAILSFISWRNNKLCNVSADVNLNEVFPIFAILMINAGLTLNDVKELGINVKNLLLSSFLSEFIQGLKDKRLKFTAIFLALKKHLAISFDHFHCLLLHLVVSEGLDPMSIF